jgi:hypothetical protein
MITNPATPLTLSSRFNDLRFLDDDREERRRSRRATATSLSADAGRPTLSGAAIARPAHQNSQFCADTWSHCSQMTIAFAEFVWLLLQDSCKIKADLASMRT